MSIQDNGNNNNDNDITIQDINIHESHESHESESLSTIFSKLQLLYDNAIMNDSKGENLDVAINLVQKCSNLVHKLHLFSKNEEIDDILTSSLKYLFVDYYHGKLLSFVQDSIDDKTKRLNSLKLAKVYLEKFLQNCLEIKLLNDDDKAFVQLDDIDLTLESPEMTRNRKIALYKLNKQTKERIQVFI